MWTQNLKNVFSVLFLSWATSSLYSWQSLASILPQKFTTSAYNITIFGSWTFYNLLNTKLEFCLNNKKFKKCWINYSTGRKKCFYGQDLTRRSCITHPWSNFPPDLILTKWFIWAYFVPMISDFWLGQKQTYEIESSIIVVVKKWI